MSSDFNILICAQGGRLEYEAVLFAASLRDTNPEFAGQLFVAVPAQGPKWPNAPQLSEPVSDLLQQLGAQIVSFENEVFGESYPYGNKIEALRVLPEDQPFVFFDTDTLITGDLGTVPFDFGRPSASLRREGTWPEIELYGPGYGDIWKSLYDLFDLDYESSLDLAQPDEYWQRYLYFNAGFFYYSCPKVFGEKFTHFAKTIRDAPPEPLVCQSLDPWLDQIALPLVIHSLGGGKDTLPAGYLDGEISCHYRMLPLLYARENDRVVETLERVSAPNKIKKVIKAYEPIRRMIYQKRGNKVRALFDQDNLPKRERQIRNTIKREGFWMR